MKLADYYPPTSFYFSVAIDGIIGIYESNFQEVSGISAKTEVTSIVEGGENRFVHRVPVRAKYENLVLKRGMLVGSFLIDWIEKAIIHHDFDPRLVYVNLLSPPVMGIPASGGLPLATWKFVNAYPVSWSLSDLKSKDNEIAVESLELAYQYFESVSLTKLMKT